MLNRERGTWSKTRRVKTPAPARPALDAAVKAATIKDGDLFNRPPAPLSPREEQAKKFVTTGPQPTAPSTKSTPASPRPSDLSAPPPSAQPGLMDSARMMRNLMEKVNQLSTMYLEGNNQRQDVHEQADRAARQPRVAPGDVGVGGKQPRSHPQAIDYGVLIANLKLFHAIAWEEYRVDPTAPDA